MISSVRRDRLHHSLEELYRRTDFPSRIPQDPIVFPRRFQNPRDIEVVGWLASALAYGRVPLFQAAMEKILAVMGGKPSRYVVEFNPAKDAPSFSSLYYRMNRGEDIACLVYLIQQVIRRHGSVGKLFAGCYRDEDSDIGPALERFIEKVRGIDTAPIYGKNVRPYGLSQFFSVPSKGSACKRLNLYLRWMVRPNDGLDFGLWSSIPPAKLVIPLDTHVLRIGRYLGLTRRKSSGWSTAREITDVLKQIDAKDPLKYDFPLCHLGISGNCPLAKCPPKCEVCPLLPVCAKGRMLAPAIFWGHLYPCQV